MTRVTAALGPLRQIGQSGRARLVQYSTRRPLGVPRVVPRYLHSTPWRRQEAAKEADTDTTLSTFLKETIAATGPIPLSSYMRQCLTSPVGGYYVNRDPFGVSGDFTTSPEISQMFGELVGIWVLTQWLAQGCPQKFRIVEFGPGRGTLMSDLLRAGRSFKDFSNALTDIYMIEASPSLREAQREKLCGSASLNAIDGGYMSMTKWGAPIYWFESAKEIPRSSGVPTFILAHEFFDALPISQFENTKDGWRELLVDYSVPKDDKLLPNQTKLTPSGKEGEEQFHLVMSPYSTASSKIVPKTHSRYSKLPVGSRVEICPEAWDISQEFAAIIESNGGGAALIVDYGPSATIPVNTLRGIRKHKLVSPFEAPGDTDLSADVDFQAIKIAATKGRQVDVHGPIMQGDWLHAMGIGARATQLADNKNTKEGKEDIEKAYNRLVEKSGGAMGKIYKVLCILPRGAAIPVGFGGSVADPE